jgi:hypothetical protein
MSSSANRRPLRIGSGAVLPRHVVDNSQQRIDNSAILAPGPVLGLRVSRRGGPRCRATGVIHLLTGAFPGGALLLKSHAARKILRAPSLYVVVRIDRIIAKSGFHTIEEHRVTSSDRANICPLEQGLGRQGRIGTWNFKNRRAVAMRKLFSLKGVFEYLPYEPRLGELTRDFNSLMSRFCISDLKPSISDMRNEKLYSTPPLHADRQHVFLS